MSALHPSRMALPYQTVARIFDVIAEATSFVLCVESVLQGSDQLAIVGSQLKSRLSDRQRGAGSALVQAFDYHMPRPGAESRRVAGCALFPQIELGASAYPPPIEAQPESFFSSIEHLLRVVQNPAARARLADILWHRRWGKSPHQFAQAAIAAYVAAARDESWHTVEITTFLLRALELSRLIQDRELIRSAIGAIEDRAKVLLASDSQAMLVPLLSVLADLDTADRPNALADHVSNTFDRFRHDPFIRHEVLEIQRRIARDSDERRIAAELKVSSWRTAARSSSGFLRQHHLERALRIALDAGLTDQVDQIRRELEAMSIDELEMKKIETSVDVPASAIDQFISTFEGSTWSETVALIGSHIPIAAYHESMAEVERVSREHPLSRLFGLTIVDSRGNPIRHVESGEERTEYELIQHDARSITFWGVMLVEILRKAFERLGPPTASVLREALATDLIGEQRAERFARGLVLYVAGHPDDAACVMLPRIESVLRDAAEAVGVPIVELPRDNSPTGLSQLGKILSDLANHLDDTVRRYLKYVLVEPMSLNLRNDLLHGLAPVAGAVEAALILHCASVLAGFTLNSEAAAPEC